jgi:hypothetical protein
MKWYDVIRLGRLTQVQLVAVAVPATVRVKLAEPLVPGGFLDFGNHMTAVARRSTATPPRRGGRRFMRGFLGFAGIEGHQATAILPQFEGSAVALVALKGLFRLK